MKLFFSGPVLLYFSILFQIFCPPMLSINLKPPLLARHSCKICSHTTHATHPSRPPTQKRQPRHARQHATHASTSPMQTCHLHHQRQHKQHSISQIIFRIYSAKYVFLEFLENSQNALVFNSAVFKIQLLGSTLQIYQEKNSVTGVFLS